MGFWIFMFAMDLLIPVLMIIIGKVFTVSPPETINGLYGYRTPMSMKNKATWDFAQKYWGKVCFKYAFIALPTALLLFAFLGKSEDAVGIAGAVISCAQCAVMVFTIFATERALKKIFDKNGEKI